MVLLFQLNFFPGRVTMWYIQYEYVAPADSYVTHGEVRHIRNEIPLDCESIHEEEIAMNEAKKWLRNKGKSVRTLSNPFLVWKKPLE